jgi:hypothetical protein
LKSLFLWIRASEGNHQRAEKQRKREHRGSEPDRCQRGEGSKRSEIWARREEVSQTAKKPSLIEQADNPTAVAAAITEAWCRYLHGFEVLELGKYGLRPVQRPPLFPAAAAILEVTLWQHVVQYVWW